MIIMIKWVINIHLYTNPVMCVVDLLPCPMEFSQIKDVGFFLGHNSNIICPVLIHDSCYFDVAVKHPYNRETLKK